MTDHKLEPFEKVLVRDTDAQNWTGLLYSHKIGDIHMCGDMSWKQCIPYTPETAHLLGTNAPYEPPKPPHEYKWGDKVEVRNADGKWNEAVFINFDPEDFFPFAVMIKGHISFEYFQKENIRPLEPSDE